MTATNEPTDEDHPHPGQRVNIEELASRKASDASNWSPSSPKRPATANSAGDGTWKDLTTSETWSQKQHGVEVRDFASAKGGAKGGAKSGAKPKGDVENSRQMLEKSSLM
jgi:hypothetical protein